MNISPEEAKAEYPNAVKNVPSNTTDDDFEIAHGCQHKTLPNDAHKLSDEIWKEAQNKLSIRMKVAIALREYYFEAMNGHVHQATVWLNRYNKANESLKLSSKNDWESPARGRQRQRQRRRIGTSAT